MPKNAVSSNSTYIDTHFHVRFFGIPPRSFLESFLGEERPLCYS